MKCKNCNGNGRVTIGWDSYPCDFCHGTGEIEQTNFERITKNEGTLTSWLDKKLCFCTEISCGECIANKECWHQGNDTDYSNADLWKAWLMRPCHKEK